jgi:hypothetical protein
MIRRVARWTPTVLLAVLVAVGVITEANIEPLVALGLFAIQAVVVLGPLAARRLGEFIGERAE